ncbi:MAG: hypothetical protein ACREIW_15665 [Chthoniobacterales bacterium]
MKTRTIGSLTFSLLMAISCLPLHAGDSPKEKAFVDSYKKAFEAKDTAALRSFLYTQGSDSGILEIYKTMQSADAGEKISKIELVDFTAEEMKKVAAPKDSPTGGKVCFTLTPSKRLMITIEKTDAKGRSSTTSGNFIAEKDGKFVIPVPGPCK